MAWRQYHVLILYAQDNHHRHYLVFPLVYSRANYRVSHKNWPLWYFAKISISKGTFSAKFYTQKTSIDMH